MAAQNAVIWEKFKKQEAESLEAKAVLKNKNTGDNVYEAEGYNQAREQRDMNRKLEHGKDAAVFVNAGEAVYDEKGNLIRIKNIPQLLTDRAVAHRLTVIKHKDDSVELNIIRDPLVIAEILKNNISRPSYSVDVFVKKPRKDGRSKAPQFEFIKTTTVEAKEVIKFKDSLPTADFLKLYTNIDDGTKEATKSANGSVKLADL